MRLSKRIYAIADKVLPGQSVADIGTDHGYVPMLLMKNGVSPHTIMSDISEGSLSKAIETFELAGINESSESFRVGDGLDTLAEGEVDCIIIAGLGGFTIKEILEADLRKSKSFKRIIMQPRKHSGNLRYFLYVNGWDIVDEAISPEGKFVCEIITAEPSAVDMREAPYPEDDIRWKYPRAIVDADPDLAAKRIGWKIGSITDEILSLQSSSSDYSELIEKLSKERAYLEELISEKA